MAVGFGGAVKLTGESEYRKALKRKGILKMQNMDDFIESLLEEKGITDIDDDVKAELKEDMKKRLIGQINQAAAMELSEEKAAELASMVELPYFTSEKMVEFMQESGVDLSEVTRDCMIKFRNFYLGMEG